MRRRLEPLPIRAYELRVARLNQAGTAGIVLVLILLGTRWPIEAGVGIVALLAYLLQGVPVSRRTLRWSRSMEIARAPDDVFAFMADPERVGSLMAPSFYPLENRVRLRHGVVETRIVSVGDNTIVYRQRVISRNGGTLDACSITTLDAQSRRFTTVTDLTGYGADRVAVETSPHGSWLTFRSEIQAPYWSGGIRISLDRRRHEWAAGERLAGLLERVKRHLEEETPPG